MVLHLNDALEFQNSFKAITDLIQYFTYFGAADTYGDDFPAQNFFLTSRHKANWGRIINFLQSLCTYCYGIEYPGTL